MRVYVRSPFLAAILQEAGATRVADNINRCPHQPGHTCVNHCYSHNIDEPAEAYLWCGECFHAFPTARALRRDARRNMARIYWHDLTHAKTIPAQPAAGPFAPFDPETAWAQRRAALHHLARLPFLRTTDITFCPHCIHDL